MGWLKEITRKLAKTGRGVHWTNPIGFPLVLEEHEYKEKPRIHTRYGGSFVNYDRNKPLKLDEGAQGRGIVPNFVHSLDSTHMMLTVNALHRKGFQHFAMVHDSYGVHASDVDELNKVLRKQFVYIYEKKILEDFLAKQRVAGRCPNFDDSSGPGTLDIRKVLDSDYFFS